MREGEGGRGRERENQLQWTVGEKLKVRPNACTHKNKKSTHRTRLSHAQYTSNKIHSL